MRLSAYFLPTLRENPAEAEIVSHRLMLRAGMIRQTAAGIYTWLPMGLRVLRKIEAIVREEQVRAGAQEVLMATIQPADLWRESGRYDDYGDEMLRIKDRRDRELLYGPTNEEAITAIVRDQIKTYRDLPKHLFQIQWKFRDELRPRFGVMRGREFLMKDNYSFDLDEAGARISYYKMFLAYLRTFARMGMKAIPMRADTGPIGGDLSHEFIILAETGESEVFCDPAWLTSDVLANSPDYGDDLSAFYQTWTSVYAATSDIHNPATCPVPGDRLVHTRGIEVGHIFSFGTKYSLPMKAEVTDSTGALVPMIMGSYGIGVSRLVAAIIEASHDEAGIIWPPAVAPYQVMLINLKPSDPATAQASNILYRTLIEAGIDVLYDDREESAGAKFATADLVGIPYQVILGPRGVAKGVAEIKDRKTANREECRLEDVLTVIKGAK